MFQLDYSSFVKWIGELTLHCPWVVPRNGANGVFPTGTHCSHARLQIHGDPDRKEAIIEDERT